ncbi:MAG: VTT domain-containing protein [Desulfobacterota bacterium]|nr:VTT domain-containing protein [Thermodesulfobacteriota bacterium]
MRAHGQLSVFIGVMIEQVIVPIPSPMIVMGAGAILIPPDLSVPNGLLQILWVIVLPGTIASTLGSFIGYTISYYGGKTLVIRLERFLGVDWDEIERLERRFQGKKVALSLLLSRAIPAFPLSLVSVFAGLLRIPVRPFTLYTFIGSIFRILFLGFLGWWVGATYEKIATQFDTLETIVSVLMLIAMGGALGYFYYKFRRKG